MHGAGKKNETFDRYARRVGAENRTPVTSSTAAAAAARTVDTVKRKLGRFYKPPLKA